MKKILTFLIIIIFGVTLSSCAKLNLGEVEDLDPVENNEDIPTNIVLESVTKKHKLYIGDNLELKATVQPSTVTEPVIFSSNDESIATVNSLGIVTGISEGLVKITAKVSKTISLFETKTVEDHLYLTVEKRPVEIEAVEISGEASVYTGDILKLDIIKNPVDATYNGTWSSSDNTIASIDQNGRLLAHKAGVVEVEFRVDEEISSKKTITVLERSTPPTSINIEVRDLLEVGSSLRAYISTTPVGALNTVTWESSNPEIASIDEDGLVTGLSEGSTTITAKYNDEVFSSTVIKVIDYRIDTTTLEDNLVDLVRTRKDSVFGVSNYIRDMENDLIRSSIGSGFVYKYKIKLLDNSIVESLDEIRSFSEVDYFIYYLITNRHVVQGSDALKIYMPKIDSEVNARLIQYDDKEDIAVVTFNYEEFIKPLVLADSDALEAGRFAVAIGNPSGYEFSSTATFGMISSPSRFLPTDTDGDGVNDWDAEYIQHDVAINPGNSGGPLFNLQGEVIGVNTLKYASTNIEGMGFSIPSNVVKNLIPVLETGEKPKRATLGVSAIEVKNILLDPKSEYIIPEGINFGLYVVGVVEGSPAALGGIMEGDIITSFNDVELTSIVLLRGELNQIILGENMEIEVVVYRNDEYLNLNLVFE